MEGTASARKPVQGLARYNPMIWLRRLYDWVVGWAETKYSQWALFFIAFVESSIFPIPPDVLLIAMGVGQPKKALRFALICTVGSVMGGVLGFYIGWGLWSMVAEIFFRYIPGFTPENFEKVAELYRENAFVAVFSAGFTPLPYKVFTISAGIAEVALTTFFVASVLSRGARFFLVGTALYVFGPSIQEKLEKHFGLFTTIFFLLGVGGFVAIKYLL